MNCIPASVLFMFLSVRVEGCSLETKSAFTFLIVLLTLLKWRWAEQLFFFSGKQNTGPWAGGPGFFSIPDMIKSICVTIVKVNSIVRHSEAAMEVRSKRPPALQWASHFAGVEMSFVDNCILVVNLILILITIDWKLHNEKYYPLHLWAYNEA